MTEAGAGVQVETVNAAGSVQVNATAELNPPTGVTVAVMLMELPFVTVSGVDAVTVKSDARLATNASDVPVMAV